MDTAAATKMILDLPAGKTWGVSPAKATQLKQDWYCCVRRADGGYQVEAGRYIGAQEAWNAHDNDAQISEGWLESIRTVGSAAEAAELYLAAKNRLISRQSPQKALGLPSVIIDTTAL